MGKTSEYDCHCYREFKRKIDAIIAAWDDETACCSEAEYMAAVWQAREELNKELGINAQ